MSSIGAKRGRAVGLGYRSDSRTASVALRAAVKLVYKAAIAREGQESLEKRLPEL